MKLILIVIAIAVTLIIADITYPPIAQTETPSEQLQRYDLDYSDEVFHEDPSAIIPSASDHRRFNRDVYDEGLKSYVNRLKKVARVTNGIYLQQELIAGTIPSDKLIVELLHFGSVNLSQIISMETENMKGAIDTLKNLPESLEANPEIAKVETVFEGLEEILDAIVGVDDIREWTDGKEDFKKEVQELATKGVKIRWLDDMTVGAGLWKSNYDKLVEADDSMTDDDLKKYFADLINGIERIKSNSLKLQNVEPVWKFMKFNSSSEGLSPIAKASKALNLYIKNYLSIGFSENQEKTYLTYFGSLPTMMKPVNAVQPALNDVKKLMTSRLTNKQNLEYLSGFPDGPADISTMFDDLKESWMRDTVKNSERLSTAMNRMKEFESSVNKVERSLGSKEEGHSEIEGLFKIINGFTEIISRTELMKKGVAEGRKCVRVNSEENANQGFPILAEHVKSIDEKLVKLKDLIGQLATLAKTPGIPDMFDGLITICKEAETSKNVTEVVEKFLQNENRTALNNHVVGIKDLVDSIQAVEKPVTIKKHAEDAKATFGDLEETHKFINEKYAAYFVCLQEQAGLKLVFKTIAELQKIRVKKGNQKYLDQLDKGMDVMNKVAGTKDHLMELEKSINKMKGFKSPETDALSLMTDASKHSNTLGSSIQGISNMYNTLEQQSDVTKILDYKDLIQTTMGNLTDPDDVANLKKLIELGVSITEMYSTLDEFKKKVKDSEATILENHFAIFSHATIVKGIDMDLLAISASVRKLADAVSDTTTKEQLNALEKDLKTIDTMGLQFSKYKTHLDNSKKSLTALDLFFASYNYKFAPTTLKPPQQEDDESTTILLALINGPQPDEDKTMLYIYVSAGCVCTAAALISYFKWVHPVFKRLYEKWRKRKDFEDEDIYNPIDDRGWCRLYWKKVYGYITTAAAVHNVRDGQPWETFYACFYNMFNADTLAIPAPKVNEMVPFSKRICRHNVPLKNATRIDIEGLNEVLWPNTFFHANEILLPRELRPGWPSRDLSFIMTEGPKVWRAADDQNFVTAIPFWWTIYQRRIKMIQMLCPLVGPNGEVQCDMYFPDKVGEKMFIESLTLECMSKIVDYDGLLEERVIKGQFRGQDAFYCTHFWFLGWVDPEGVPTKIKPLAVMFEKAENNYDVRTSDDYMMPDVDDGPSRSIPPKWHVEHLEVERPAPICPEKPEPSKKPVSEPPVMVHCSDGTGRTGSYVLMCHLVKKHRVDRQKTVNFGEALKTVRDARLGSVHNGHQYGFAAYGAGEILTMTACLDANEMDTEMRNNYTYIKSGFWNWRKGEADYNERKLKKPQPAEIKDAPPVEHKKDTTFKDSPVLTGHTFLATIHAQQFDQKQKQLAQQQQQVQQQQQQQQVPQQQQQQVPQQQQQQQVPQQQQPIQQQQQPVQKQQQNAQPKV